MTATVQTDREHQAPVLAAGVRLLGPAKGSGYAEPPALVQRADGQAIQVTPLLYAILEAIDGTRDHAEIAALVRERTGKPASEDDVRLLIDTQLRPMGLLRDSDGADPRLRKADPLLGLRLRKEVTSPDVTRRLTAPFTVLFHPAVVAPVLVAFTLTTGWLLFAKGLASPTRQALHQPGLLLLLILLFALSAAFHEFGHAAAATRAGSAPGSMGFGLYLVWPVFYTDVTDSYRLGRGSRLLVDAGGLYFNAVFSVASVGMWAVTGWDALLLLVPAQLLLMLRQLLPIVRFDGYHILADLTGVPDLFAHLKPTLMRLLPGGRRREAPLPLKPWARAIVTVWVLTVVPLLALALVALVIVLPRVAATFMDSLAPRWGQVQGNWTGGDPAGAVAGTLAIAALALPVLSMSYVLLRVARRTTVRMWRGTEGRPVKRGLATVAWIACLLLLARAWWPDGQYRPIRADERGTLQQMFAVAVGPQEPSGPPSLAAYLTDARGSLEPQMVLLLTPVDSESGEPSHVVVVPPSGELPDFPFDLPGAPGAGDNQALAVNTADGTVLYDVAVAIVWVTDGAPIDQVNEAWAIASCTDCTTAAVAFQSIFVVGDSAVAVPQNLAVAVNYECDRCETFALAVQLVVTLSDLPSDEAMARLSELWEDLERLEQEITTLSAEEIQAELVAIEAAILQVLEEDGVLELGETSGASPSPGSTPTPTSSSSVDPSPTAEPSADPTPSATPTTSPSVNPSPTATPSSEPSPDEPSPTSSAGT